MPEPVAADRIFISIGVSRPADLDQLPGAIKAAKRMAAWATAQSYATVLIDDDAGMDVTIDRLRDEIAAAIKSVTDATELKRLMIFFAGHGMASGVGDQYWILSNWKKRPTEAIKVSSLQRMLEYYGPRQVAMIGDACQEFSAKFIDVVGSPVLDMPDEEQRHYELDQFFAVDVGKQAFMIKAAGGQEDFCLFTEVLLDALEGDSEQASFEQIGGDKFVTSQSLASYLDNNVAREAGKYGVRMVPRPKPGFYTDRVYLKIPPPEVIIHSPAGSATASTDGWLGNESAVHHGARDDAHSVSEIGAGPGMEIIAAPRSVARVVLTEAKRPSSELADANRAINDQREASRKEFADEVAAATVRDHFETGCGICISGTPVTKVDAASGEVSDVDGQPNWFRIRLDDEPSPLGWSDTLVTLADGRIVAACSIQGFVTALHIINDTSLSLFHRPIGAAEYEGRVAIDLLAQVHAGLLTQAQIIDAALSLRYGKHRIITLGCIAAQFYDTIRDVDSLRSMASFYASHHQPVPLDIVLYGGGSISESDGRLFADIPAVAARTPRTPEEAKQGFTTDATPAFDRHPIAGRVPWMRQAWGAVATARCDKSAEPWRAQAMAALAHLAPGTFTTIAPGGRDALLALAGVRARVPMAWHGQSQ